MVSQRWIERCCLIIFSFHSTNAAGPSKHLDARHSNHPAQSTGHPQELQAALVQAGPGAKPGLSPSLARAQAGPAPRCGQGPRPLRPGASQACRPLGLGLGRAQAWARPGKGQGHCRCSGRVQARDGLGLWPGVGLGRARAQARPEPQRAMGLGNDRFYGVQVPKRFFSKTRNKLY